MTGYLLPGIPGLLLGLALHWTGLSRPDGLRDALALRRCHTVRSLLYALGVPMALTPLLGWLAVIDVDGIAVLPLTAGALAGGAVFGVAAALGGCTPLTAFAGLGGARSVEALCTLAGCLAAALALPWLSGPLTALQALPPLSATTLFQVTLDEPFLLGGGFLGQACAGLLLMAIAVCIPSNLHRSRPDGAAPAEVLPPESDAADAVAPDAPAEEAGQEASAEAEPPPEPSALTAPDRPLLLPSAAPEETFIALLPGEEPLVVDTAPPEGEPEDEASESAADAD